jgi:hypothetical protein
LHLQSSSTPLHQQISQESLPAKKKDDLVQEQDLASPVLQDNNNSPKSAPTFRIIPEPDAEYIPVTRREAIQVPVPVYLLYSVAEQVNFF